MELICPHCKLDDMIDETASSFKGTKLLWVRIFCNRCGLESKIVLEDESPSSLDSKSTH